MSRADLDAVWAAPGQLARALDGLVADGLVDPLPDGRYALPGAGTGTGTGTGTGPGLGWPGSGPGPDSKLGGAGVGAQGQAT